MCDSRHHYGEKTGLIIGALRAGRRWNKKTNDRSCVGPLAVHDSGRQNLYRIEIQIGKIDLHDLDELGCALARLVRRVQLKHFEQRDEYRQESVGHRCRSGVLAQISGVPEQMTDELDLARRELSTVDGFGSNGQGHVGDRRVRQPHVRCELAQAKAPVSD